MAIPSCLRVRPCSAKQDRRPFRACLLHGLGLIKTGKKGEGSPSFLDVGTFPGWSFDNTGLARLTARPSESMDVGLRREGTLVPVCSYTIYAIGVYCGLRSICQTRVLVSL